MNRLLIAGMVAGVGAALVACVSIDPGDPPLVVSISHDGEICRVIVSGERVTSDRLTKVSRATRHRRAIVIYNKETPFKCVGGAVYALQRGGLAKIDAVIWDGVGDH